MSFEIKVKTDDKVAGTKKLGVTITQDGKPFYRVDHTWAGFKEEKEARFQEVLAPLMGAVGITPSGDGTMGPVSEEEMILFEIGMTNASRAFNQWAVEDAKSKGRETCKAEAALELL
jgi:hypothetical protein